MRRFLFLVLQLSCAVSVYAQDDLMKIMDEQSKSTIYTTATFKSTRVINGQSVETVAKKHLDFRISHRFGTLNSAAYGFWGLDQAYIRLGLEYGITDNFMAGLGRSSMNKTIDFFGKYKLLKQSSGEKTSPVSIVAFFSTAINGMKSIPGYMEFSSTQDRLAFTSQIIVARKFNDKLSLQLTPTIIHRNKTQYATEPNNIYAMGIGGRYKISKRVSVNGEYFLVMPNQLDMFLHYNNLSLGVDIETGGHVFQLHFTNSQGMIENQFIAETTDKWSNGGIHLGFNISRTFSFEKKEKKW